jgi:hypothetical protein
LGAQLDDIGDIYDHRSIFKEKGGSDFQEVDARRIRASIADDQYDEKVYGAKKVSRKQREQQVSEQEEESSLEEASEGGESSMEESS